MTEMAECRKCGKEVPRAELEWSRDCHGIPFRPVCMDCMEEIDEVGYDGEYYDERDEQIDDDY